MMKQYLESLVIFAFFIGSWAVITAFVVSTLMNFHPGEEIVEYVGGWFAVLLLFVAIGVAARLTRRRLTF